MWEGDTECLEDAYADYVATFETLTPSLTEEANVPLRSLMTHRNLFVLLELDMMIG